MSLYVDSSALLKRYVAEPDSATATEHLKSDATLVTGRHTGIEVRRNLARLLGGSDLTSARDAFQRDLSAFWIVECDAVTCELAATLAEQTGARTLDALHLACAVRAGGTGSSFLTFDIRQAQAARTVGLVVLGR